MTQNSILLPDAPAIPGLSFRHFRGPVDYPAMVAAVEASADADRVERVTTVADITNMYEHLTNCDPFVDMIFAEMKGDVIGYSRGWWADEENGPRLYAFVGFLVPAWRRHRIGPAMLLGMEPRWRRALNRVTGPRARQLIAVISTGHGVIRLTDAPVSAAMFGGTAFGWMLLVAAAMFA